ncbi:MAG: alpha-amylase/4-alpha-glucanotransferase domain-containing protein, partial [Dethiobacteria bacterium]
YGEVREQGELFVQKDILLPAASQEIEIKYHLQNNNEQGRPLSFRFGVEFNLAFLAGYAPDRYYHIPGRQLEQPFLASKGVEEEVEELCITDEWRKLHVALRFSRPVRLWRFPVETVSQSEDGLERVYQQSVLVPNLDLTLGPQESAELDIKLAINSGGGF